MNKKEVIFGFIIGIITTFIGILIFAIYTGIQLDLNMNETIKKAFSSYFLGKRASIGVLLNLPVFYYFLNKEKEDYAKGVLIAIVIVALIFIVNKF